MHDTDREPDSVTPTGHKWWVEHQMTRHAREPDSFGRTLEGYTAFIVEDATGHKIRLLVDGDNTPVYETTGLEAMACHIDILKLLNEAGDQDGQQTVQ